MIRCQSPQTSSGQVDLEEMKLALGLRIQNAARAGMDGDGAGWTLMQERQPKIDKALSIWTNLEPHSRERPSSQKKKRTMQVAVLTIIDNVDGRFA